jgi:putative tryptophan/tyrosine transport system substrate-binding protein
LCPACTENDPITIGQMVINIGRRQFISALGGAIITWPLAARAQQPMPVIGFLNSASPDGYAPMLAAFRQALKEGGFVEGQNVAIEYRWAEGQYDRLPAMAADLVHRDVAVIVANTPANVTAKKATTTIPIVFTTGSDPVQLGLVTSLSRPGGNVTGVTQLTVEVTPKRLELAHELIPAAHVIGLLVNPRSPQAVVETRDLQAAATNLGLQLTILQASTEAELADAFTAFAQQRVAAVVIAADPFFSGMANKLGELAIRHSLPTIFQFREFVAAGGLASYAGSIADSYRLAGSYTGRILKGENPADLPVQESTKVELILNLKAAKTLGITIPITLLGRADEVIE